LLILDEPTNTLDPTMRDILLQQLRAARQQGRTVLFSSHVLHEVEQLSDRVGILHKGRLVHLQALSELRQARRIRIRLGKTLEEAPRFAGLREVTQHDGQLILNVDGALAPALEWLASLPVQELTVEPAGLDAVYHRYHGAET
jgi:ABC-2 type transport system ATP-binding protein